MYLSFVATGLSYVDAEKLTAKQIVKGYDGGYWIMIDRTKTGSPSNIPILLKASSILQKYKDNLNVIATGRLLPVMSNQRINAYLKKLATLAKIDKNLTFHAARHTFETTVTLSNGTPIETVSSMLGHKNFKTTQIYAKVVQEKISNDICVMVFVLGSTTNNGIGLISFESDLDHFDTTVLKRESMIKTQDPKESFAYYGLLALIHQKRKGISSAFIQEVIDKCERQQRPIYLETSMERNLSFTRNLVSKFSNHST